MHKEKYHPSGEAGNGLAHDPEKLQTFRARSCSKSKGRKVADFSDEIMLKTKTWSMIPKSCIGALSGRHEMIAL